MKYKKRPVVVDAVQWFKDGDHPAVHRGEGYYRKEISPGILYQSEKYYIKTLEGTLTVSPGDWIITGVQGEHYPCKPDIFEQTYEVVDETIMG